MAVEGPDFLCFGLQKAGTQWLYDQMNSCDQVWMTPIKELNYFAARSYKGSNVRTLEKFLARKRVSTIADAREEAFFRLFAEGRDGEPDISWYRGLFAPKADRLSGDVSPLYATLDDAGVRRVVSACPDAKFLFLLRNPVDRLWSALCMNMRKGKLGEDELANWSSVKNVVSSDRYARRSYSTDIWSRWAERVPVGSIRYWFLDDVIAKPNAVRDEIASFVGLASPDFSVDAAHNKKSGHKKLPMPSDVRAGLTELFGEEIERCGRLFGGAALHWQPKG